MFHQIGFTFEDMKLPWAFVKWELIVLLLFQCWFSFPISELLSALSRCSRSFVLRITSDKLIFVLPDKDAANATSTVSIWGEIPQDPYFAEYAMEGVSPDQNEIFLEIYPGKTEYSDTQTRASTN